MEIPYVNLQSHHNLLNGEGAWGIIYINCYLPFGTGSTGSTDVNCVLWLSIHDVELVAPSIPLVVAQMDNSTNKNMSVARRTRVKRGKGPIEQEKEKN